MKMFLLLILTIQLVKTDQGTQEGYTRYPFPYKVTIYRSFRPAKANQEKIQYAPLLLKPDYNYDYPTSSTKYDENTGKYEEDLSHLEPRFDEDFRPNKAPLFVPAYNLVFDSQRILEKESRTEQNVKKENHLPHILEYKMESEKAGLPLKTNNVQHNVFSIQKDTMDNYKFREESQLNKHNIKESSQRYPKTLIDLESKSIQPSLVVKTPRLHLNVARAYNFAFVPHKALPHLNELLLVRKVPSQNEKNFHKTFLASHSSKNNCKSPQPY